MLDISKKENLDVITRFLYNLMQMFNLKDSQFTLITFGQSSSAVFDGKTFGDKKEIQEALKQVNHY